MLEDYYTSYLHFDVELIYHIEIVCLAIYHEIEYKYNDVKVHVDEHVVFIIC